MKRSPAASALVLAIVAASAASAQEFSGLDGLASQFAAVRAQTRAAKAIPQKAAPAPAPRTLSRVMGASRFETAPNFTIQSLPASATAAPDVASYQVRGVDISHFQLTVDWSLVKTDGLSFVYVKATEGADGVDEQFAANWAGAKSAGLARGAYHFYNFCKTGSEQAANFIKTVPADEDALPATIDLEQSGDCKTMPAKAAFRGQLAVFVSKVKAATGHQPILYVNYAIYDKYFSGEKDSYKLWIADVDHSSPALPDSASWTMWQYAWHGTLAGIPGEVDLDVFNGTPEMLASLDNPDDSIMVASLGFGPR